MNTTLDNESRQLDWTPLLPANRVRITNAVRVGQLSGKPTQPNPNPHDCPDSAVQVRTLRENGEIRYIEVQCGCGRVIRLRCEYETSSP
ncbi:hypothetical protein HRbin36_00430 [bacterium HR36]|uniref:Uncharacterized protein n=1 Tax=uncultured Planctomycetota bacterium TaxID=120965 RepID=H5SCQ3_9BACT|nr:hypothetical protein HGMM_F11F07C11 [uncultured Planctomycetota bacterium]GBD35319.1 hypothetical protein HRbin36_00430 [bacterium HR36]